MIAIDMTGTEVLQSVIADSDPVRGNPEVVRKIYAIPLQMAR